MGGAMAERLVRMWRHIVDAVGDDPVTDAHGVFARSWRDLIERYATQADLLIEGDGVAAICVADLGRMEAAVEQCIPQDEL